MIDEGQRLDQFAANLQQDIIVQAESADSQLLRAETFTTLAISQLCDSGDLDDGLAVYHRARGLEASGYAVSDDGTGLDLFVTIYTGAVPPPTVAKTDLEASIKRVLGFYERARNGYYKEIEEASPVFDMALRIHEISPQVRRLRLFVFTDGIASARFALKPAPQLKLDRSLHVWDIRRLFRAATSGATLGRIDIDFVERFGAPVPCLVDTSAVDYRTYLAIVPGSILADLYAEFGSRLLEFNVRSFLQARGKVNKGIHKTILEEPARFLAYNNGISATASEVVLAQPGNGKPGIAKVKSLQIVNGGQTTASLYYAKKADAADLSAIGVQMKLTVVDPDKLATFVPLVSRYANTQNKVNEADFAANDSFHIQLEAMSRTVWAPAAGGSQHQTKWFYERARGQYQDMLAMAPTKAKREQQKIVFPTNQKFTKTDLAKFEHTWACLPHVVSLGAEKNFREFVIRMSEAGRINVDEAYFQRIVAKAILFRSAEKLVGALKLGGYRANVVTYTLALINRRVESRLDLGLIWRSQTIGPGVAGAITTIALPVYKELVALAAGRNITEWCKREECWRAIASMDISLPASIYKEIATSSSAKYEATASHVADLARIAATSQETWSNLRDWSLETGHLRPWQRALAGKLARLSSQSKKPTAADALHGRLMLDEAARLGFEAQR